MHGIVPQAIVCEERQPLLNSYLFHITTGTILVVLEWYVVCSDVNNCICMYIYKNNLIN